MSQRAPRDSHERALRAASRVAMVALVGCGGTIEPSESPYEEPADDARTESAYASPARERTPAEEDRDAGSSADSACEDAGVETDASMECDERLAQQFPEGDPEWWSSDVPFVQDDVLAACCAARVASESRGDEFERLRTSGCCHVEGWDSFAFCTPWGPPMPPAMPREVA